MTMRILAVDPGTKRIGVALCDELEIAVRPLPVLASRGGEHNARAIAELARAHGAEGIVIGWPLHMDGTISPSAERARRLARRLHALTGLPVVLWDERLTSVEAETLLRERGERPTPERIDQVAACVILQDFLTFRRSHAARAGTGEFREGEWPSPETAP
jgi:putative Holliday junction resolvase